MKSNKVRMLLLLTTMSMIVVMNVSGQTLKPVQPPMLPAQPAPTQPMPTKPIPAMPAPGIPNPTQPAPTLPAQPVLPAQPGSSSTNHPAVFGNHMA